MLQTGIALPAANPGIRKFNGWDFCRLPNGRLLVACTPHVDVWTDATFGKYREHRLRVYVYDDQLTPEPASYVEIESNYATAPVIECDPSGRVHLLYYLWDTSLGVTDKTILCYRRSDDGGANWTARQQISTAPYDWSSGLGSAAIASGVGLRDQRDLLARINSHTGLLHVLFRANSTANPIKHMAGVMGPGGWVMSAPQSLPTAQGDPHELQALSTGKNFVFPRRWSIEESQSDGTFSQVTQVSIDGGGFTGRTGLVDEANGSWLMLFDAGSRAVNGLAGTGQIFVWGVRTVNASGGWDPGSTATKSGANLGFPAGYIEAFRTATLSDGYFVGSARLRRRTDGGYELLYSRYSDGNLVFKRCRKLPGAVTPSNPGTWQS